MVDTSCEIQHFILTRFNLLLWRRDKEGAPVRTQSWLEHRFSIFEKYCFPSVKNQTNKNFEWIVLFDGSTPDVYKQKIVEYQKACPQFVPIYVETENGRYFARYFRNEVAKRLTGKRVITSYLDNDDALDIHFVEDLQQRAVSLSDETFVFYSQGYQLFTDHNYVMRIHYPRNHFVSVIERSDPAFVKTIYGYGSHYYIQKIEGAQIEYVRNHPIWCEVIHEKNMGNDAYFLNAKMVTDETLLRRNYALDITVNHGLTLYLFRFLPRYCKTFIRRCGHFLFGRHW